VAFKSINIGLVVTLALPAFAILASLNVAFIAFRHGDPTLPDEYHWEGMRLDRDFAESRRAAALDVRAQLQLTQVTGACSVVLQLNGTMPRELVLKFVHGTRPELDRRVRLTPSTHGYAGNCGVVPAGHWHLELADDAGRWSVREDVFGMPDGSKINARL
jgi:hypothetical protein